MKIKSYKPLWIVLIVIASLLLLAVIVGVLNGTVGKGEWQIGIQSYRYESEDPNVGSGTVYADVTALDLDWICGDVEILISEDDRYVSVTEASEETLAEVAKLRWWVDSDGKLTVKSRKSGEYLAPSMPKKKLTVRVPKDMIAAVSSLNVNASRGDVSMELTEELGFSVLFETRGGQLLSNLPLTEQNGRYVHGDGSVLIYIKTGKGSLTFR